MLVLWAFSATAQNPNSVSNNTCESCLDSIDRIAGIEPDTTVNFKTRTTARKAIRKTINAEWSILFYSSQSKAVSLYHMQRAGRYARSTQCIKGYRKKDLKRRWIVKRQYLTVFDTIYGEKKDITGINLGSDRNPLGIRKPIKWISKYKYNDCRVILKGCSNNDGQDNFLFFTSRQVGSDTLCDIRLPRSNAYTILLDKSFKSVASKYFQLKIYNQENRNFSPGACSAFVSIKSNRPIITSSQRIKRITISKIR
jgi:hypothetical protein